MSAGLQIQFDSDLRKFDRRIQRLAQANMGDLMENIGSEVEAQTRNRIKKDKRTPDGDPWDPWSDEYADSQHGDKSGHGPHPGQLLKSGGHSLLELDGGLFDSIQHSTSGKETIVGSDLPYAGAMQAQRPYIGLSNENEDDIEDLVVRWILKQLR